MSALKSEYISVSKRAWREELEYKQRATAEPRLVCIIEVLTERRRFDLTNIRLFFTSMNTKLLL